MPVSRMESIRLLMALAAQRGQNVYQLDIVSAYLNGTLNEEVFMEVPEFLEEALQRIVHREDRSSSIARKARIMLKSLSGRAEKVCRLKKAIYGLRQAGRQWYAKLNEVLRGLGLSPSHGDPCLYYSGHAETFTLLVVYVDDILFFSHDSGRVEELKKGLARHFRVKDLGLARQCLGIEINQNRKGISLTQRKYTEDILQRFNMGESKSVSTPAESNQKLYTDNRQKNGDTRKPPYRELIGSLMYLLVATRPDIANVVSRLSQFNSCHSTEHWAAAKRVLRYLRGTLDHGLMYGREKGKIVGYVDADFANCPTDRISFTGYAFMLSGAAICWSARKQRTVALSST